MIGLRKLEASIDSAQSELACRLDALALVSFAALAVATVALMIAVTSRHG